MISKKLRLFNKLFFIIAASIVANTPASSTEQSKTVTSSVSKSVLFQGMESNSIKILGKFNCPSYLKKEGKGRCFNLLAYSGFVYNWHTGLMTQFGGGHSATSNNSLNYYDYEKKKWISYYLPTPCVDMKKHNFDPIAGSWLSDRKPLARHTYDQILVNRKKNEFILLRGTEVKGSECGFSVPKKGSIAFYRFDAKEWRYLNKKIPWSPYAMVEQDPITGLVLVIDKEKSWWFSPEDGRISGGKKHKAKGVNITQTLLYSVFDDSFYIVKGHHGYGLYQVRVNRESMAVTVEKLHGETGDVPPIDDSKSFAYDGFALDSKNHKIIGMFKGVFYAYDITTNHWEKLEPNSPIPLGDVKAHAIEYDPVNNIFLIVDGKKNIIAYRYK